MQNDCVPMKQKIVRYCNIAPHHQVYSSKECHDPALKML
jgi:hypothetical protein